MAGQNVRPANEQLNEEDKGKVDNFVALVESTEWKSKSDANGESPDGDIGVWTMKMPDSPFILIKASARLDISLNDLFEVLDDKELYQYFMKILDPMYRNGSIVSTPTPQRKLAHAAYRLPTVLLADRDFLWMSLLTRTEQEHVASVCWSVSEEEVISAGWADKMALPVKKGGDVRGWVNLTGLHARAVGEEASYASYVIHVDAGGWLPVWLQNLVADSQADNVRRARDHFRVNKFPFDGLPGRPVTVERS